ncbi:MAG TPA: glycosyltransferase family 2 protein [Desulfobulbus sp.]|nr:glycosyltransferase family 2 protein [Desulfobulbus sp.]
MISIIIPTRNGESSLAELLQQLKGQICSAELEILVVDSSATDATREIARKHGARVIKISAAEFDHGTTRTMAAEMAAGEYIVFLTQDAIPVDKNCISRLVAPLEQHENIAVTYGRQLPKLDASLFARHLRAFNYDDKSCVRSLKDKATLGLKTVFVSNSCAAYRASALASVGYFGGEHLFAEDACAVARLLQMGFKIAYVAEALVFHSHNYSVFQELRRYFDVGAFHRRQHWIIEEFGSAGGAGRSYVRSELNCLFSEKQYSLLPSFFVRNLMKLAGYKLGYYHTLLPESALPFLSMNPAWWEKRKRKQT